MNSKEKQELIKECTSTMSIDIDNIPNDLCIEIAELIGNVLNGFGLKFEYGGIGEGLSEKICGIQFDIESEVEQ